MGELEIARQEFVLVAGSWHGDWCMGFLAEELEGRGHNATAVDLERTDPTTFDDDAYMIASAIEGKENVIGVFSSRAGNIGPRLASVRPLRGAVYLAASFEPSTLRGRLTEEQIASLPPRNSPRFRDAIEDAGDGLTIIKRDEAADLLYRYCTPDVAEWAVQQLRAQRRGDQGPNMTGWPAMHELYLAGQGDPILSPAWQEKVTSLLGIELDTLAIGGHSPHLARPWQLAGRIARWAVALSQYPTTEITDLPHQRESM